MTSKMNVKIPTEKLIKALEGALAQRVKDKAQYQKDRKQYEKDLKAFYASLPSLIGTRKLTFKECNIRRWRTEPTVATFEYIVNDPTLEAPDAPDYPHSGDHEMNEIKNAIAILKLTNDETVNTNTYNNVARYL
jgi:hypothetical protein